MSNSLLEMATFYTRGGLTLTGMLRPVRPYGRIASLKQVVIEFADAAGTRFPFLPHIGLEVHDAFPLRFRFFLRFCLADAPVDAGGGCTLHIAGDVGVDVQRCHRRHMPQHGGEGLYVHAVLQSQRREGVPQIMKSDTLAVCPLQYRLKPPARHAGRDRSVRLHRGRKHPAGIHLFAVLPQHGQHRRRQLAADGGVCTEQVIPHGPFQGGAADRMAHPHHAVGKARAVLLRQTLAAVLFQPPVELLQIIL